MANVAQNASEPGTSGRDLLSPGGIDPHTRTRAQQEAWTWALGQPAAGCHAGRKSTTAAALLAAVTSTAWDIWASSLGCWEAEPSAGGRSRRPLLLASLTTSSLTASNGAFGDGSGSSGGVGGGVGQASRAGGGTFGGAVSRTDAGQGPTGAAAATAPTAAGAATRGFHLPQLSIMRLPVTPSFAEDQDLAQELLDYHTAKHGGYPRPCPRCKSADFMVSGEEGPSGSAAGSASQVGGGSTPGPAGDPGAVSWPSRPLVCETCGSWVHLRCAGVGLAEQPAREYDGGKYSAVLCHGSQPVAAATFNCWGTDAQLCLLATAVQHRLKGHAAALVTDLETALAGLGVRRLLVQARGPALPLWTDRFGYRLLTPEEAEAAHRALPVSYYDCALLAKELV
ncbi:hypothetical protein GPECTOR_4g723 [Gonium pectorale]|uniref:Increased DNA methylation 1 C-terminal domain-containing protein n=1 Tax=Gonium pectorale TaxID=33097 RepID=A0A150GXP3_GONPE|nr:hypothetical protein GPECTOR_4g723 [Gonium pectorale]|eukprot:KXZ54657.1 hypothetical protein GPECTOR_4g723 [Gonium pectorale]